MNLQIRNNIAVSVVTGRIPDGPDYYDKAKAVANTWGKHFKHIFYHSSTPDKSIPITTLSWPKPHFRGRFMGGEFTEEDDSENYHSGTYKQAYGLQDMWERNLGVDWYYLADCDTFAHPRNLAEALETLNPNEMIYAGGDINRSGAIKDQWPHMENPTYVGGGSGIILSKKLVDEWCSLTKKTIDPNRLGEPICVETSLKHWAEPGINLGKWWATDAFFGYEIHRLFGIIATELPGFYSHSYEHYCPIPQEDKDKIELHAVWNHMGEYDHVDLSKSNPFIDNPVAFHYIDPPAMEKLYQYAKNGQPPFHKSQF